jgi:CubicO group peptidase (beta-lactamase class C family)
LTLVGGSIAAARQVAADYWPTRGWRVAGPEEQGVDSLALEAVHARVPDEVPALSALLAARHGYIVFERYYGGQDPERPINVRSVTKSVTGTLAGAALRTGLLRGLDETVGEAIPERIPEGANPSVADITVWQWLTMTSGLEWDAHGDWQRLLAAPEWVAMTLGLPVVGIPGETYVYNTGGFHVLGVTVAKAAGKPLEEYAAETLFRPLGMSPGDWLRSPQGEVSAGSGLELTARDMLKLGLLYLRNGEWDGEQIVDAEYVTAATTWQSAGDSTGAWAGYGYQWWVTATGAGYPAYFALGYGGQHIFVVPALDLVVVAAIARRLDPGELRTPRYLIESIAAACLPV